MRPTLGLSRVVDVVSCREKRGPTALKRSRRTEKEWTPRRHGWGMAPIDGRHIVELSLIMAEGSWLTGARYGALTSLWRTQPPDLRCSVVRWPQRPAFSHLQLQWQQAAAAKNATRPGPLQTGAGREATASKCTPSMRAKLQPGWRDKASRVCFVTSGMGRHVGCPILRQSRQAGLIGRQCTLLEGTRCCSTRSRFDCLWCRSVSPCCRASCPGGCRTLICRDSRRGMPTWIVQEPHHDGKSQASLYTCLMCQAF